VSETIYKYVAVEYGYKGDPVYALYIDGKSFLAGDDYHTGLHRILEGWWRCLKSLGLSEGMILYRVHDDECEGILNGDEVPPTWPNEYSKNAKECKLAYD
jgi:hypothetical protein